MRPEWPQTGRAKKNYAGSRWPNLCLPLAIRIPFQSCPAHCWPTHIAVSPTGNQQISARLECSSPSVLGQEAGKERPSLKAMIKDNNSGKLSVFCIFFGARIATCMSPEMHITLSLSMPKPMQAHTIYVTPPLQQRLWSSILQWSSLCKHGIRKLWSRSIKLLSTQRDMTDLQWQSLLAAPVVFRYRYTCSPDHNCQISVK